MKRFLLAALLATAPALPALADARTDDVHCFIFAVHMAGEDNPQTARAGTMGVFFWLGRLNARNQDGTLDKAIAAELPKLKGDYMKSEGERCRAQMIAIGKTQEKVGDALQKLDAAPAPPAPAPEKK